MRTITPDPDKSLVLLFLCKIYVHNGCMIYGYARVSTDGQSVDVQVRQLTEVGCEKVYREVTSGAWADRAQLVAASAEACVTWHSLRQIIFKALRHLAIKMTGS